MVFQGSTKPSYISRTLSLSGGWRREAGAYSQSQQPAHVPLRVGSHGFVWWPVLCSWRCFHEPWVTRDNRTQSKSIFTSRKTVNGGQQRQSHSQKAACFSRRRKCLGHGCPAPPLGCLKTPEASPFVPPRDNPPGGLHTHTHDHGEGGSCGDLAYNRVQVVHDQRLLLAQAEAAGRLPTCPRTGERL